MKTELSHDIIAEKIWERLPEQDKRWREIEYSIQQRTRDFQNGTGDYLSAKELAAWEDVLDRFESDTPPQRFIQKSKAALQAAQAAKERQQQEELERAKQQAAHEKKLREEANKALARANAEKKRASLFLKAVIGLMLVCLVAAFLLWSNKRENLLHTASAANQSREYQKAITLWEQAKLAPFFANVEDSISIAQAAKERLDNFQELKNEGEDRFLEGDYLQAIAAFTKANELRLEDLSILIRQTEEARRLNLDIFTRKAKIFYDAHARSEAVLYLDKALRLDPDNADLKALQINVQKLK